MRGRSAGRRVANEGGRCRVVDDDKAQVLVNGGGLSFGGPVREMLLRILGVIGGMSDGSVGLIVSVSKLWLCCGCPWQVLQRC